MARMSEAGAVVGLLLAGGVAGAEQRDPAQLAAAIQAELAGAVRECQLVNQAQTQVCAKDYKITVTNDEMVVSRQTDVRLALEKYKVHYIDDSEHVPFNAVLPQTTVETHPGFGGDPVLYSVDVKCRSTKCIISGSSKYDALSIDNVAKIDSANKVKALLDELLAAKGAVAAHTDDRGDCLKGEGSPATEACGRVLAAGGLSEADQVQILMRRAALRTDQFDLDGALADYDDVLKHALDARTAAMALTSRSQVFEDMARSLGFSNKLDEANQMFDRAAADLDLAITRDPTYVPAFERRANLRLNQSKFADAIADYGRIIALEPANDDAWQERCWARFLNKDYQNALTDCTESLRLKPNRNDVLYERGLVELRLARYDAAIADFNAALKLYPADAAERAYPLYGRGYAELKKGNKTSGNADMNAAKKIDATVVDWFKAWGLT